MHVYFFKYFVCSLSCNFLLWFLIVFNLVHISFLYIFVSSYLLDFQFFSQHDAVDNSKYSIIIIIFIIIITFMRVAEFDFLTENLDSGC